MIEHTVTKESGRSYTISGVYEQVDETTIRITELPVRKWTQDYKEFLESMMNPTDKIKEPFIKVQGYPMCVFPCYRASNLFQCTEAAFGITAGLPRAQYRHPC